jgi:hypothetical protein
MTALRCASVLTSIDELLFRVAVLGCTAERDVVAIPSSSAGLYSREVPYGVELR